MHRLAEIRIQNYKSIKDLTLPLTDYTPLVGINNAGKSNILEAIEWFLHPVGLGEECFHDTNKEIAITGKIVGIDNKLIKQLDEKHQKKIDTYIIGGAITLKRIQIKPSGRKSDRKLEVRDPNIEKDQSKSFRKAPTGLPEALSKLFPDCIFIEAMDDTQKDITQYQKSTTIGQLISSLSGAIEENNKETIDSALRQLEQLFSAESENRAKQLDEFDKKAHEAISDFFPGVELKLHIPPPTIDDILKNGTVQVHDGDENLRDFEALGHGAQRSIQMAMIRLLKEFGTSNETSARKFLLIEEPELYLHPTAITNLRSALKQLSKTRFQVIFATHSPLVISRYDIPNTTLIRKNKSRGTYRLNSIREVVHKEIVGNDAQAELLFNLTNTAKILFAKTVLLMEGKTEKNTIPFIFEKVSDSQNKNKDIAFIPMNGGGGIPKAERILKAMDLKTVSLVDLDFCFREAPSKGVLKEDDEDISTCLELFSELSGDLGIALDQQGFPTGNDNYKASEAYVEFAKNKSVRKHLKKLQSKMSRKGYWMWSKGDIENILGLENKGKYDRFLRDLNKSEDWSTVIKEAEEIEFFVNWLYDY